MSKVTIGIPFFNNETTLKFAIHSVINQTFQDWQLILINDGSTDQSLEIAKQYESEKIVVINDGENKGLIYRLNQLIDMCGTKYFVRMDSDDIMTPARIEKQVSFLELQTDIDVVGAGAYIIDEKNKITGNRIPPFKSYNIDDILRKKDLFIHPTVMGRTEWFRKYKYKYGFNRAEDLELWCRSYEYSNFANIEEPLLFYRVTSKINLGKYKASFKTVKKIINLYASNRSKRIKLLLLENIKINLYTIIRFFNRIEIVDKRKKYHIEQKRVEEALSVLQNSIK